MLIIITDESKLDILRHKEDGVRSLIYHNLTLKRKNTFMIYRLRWEGSCSRPSQEDWS